MSLPTSTDPRRRRHALGLPAGSVRAILALMVIGIIWTILLLPDKQPIPAYLIYLLFLILGHFFAAHGTSIASASSPEPSPLYLPGGFIRALIVLGFVAVVGFEYYRDSEALMKQFADSVEGLKEQPYLPLLLLGGFFVGVFMSFLVGHKHPPYWFQDVQAWFALLAVIGLFIDLLIKVVINPSLAADQRLTLPHWEGALSAIVALYFGARS
jgi:hypothetical protein